MEDDNCRQNELNKLNFIKFLVNQGVGPDIPNKDNIKPIHIACKKQLSFIIEYFLVIGVNVNFTDNIGNTPLHYLLNGNLYDYVNLTPIELIQPKEYKPDELSFEDKSKFDKFIWNHISTGGKNKDIRFFKNTIEKILLNDSNFLEKYNDTLQSINDKQTEKDVISDIKSKHSEITNYLNNLFGNFREINEIEIHNQDFNSWKLNNPSGLSIIKNIGDTENPLQGYLKSKINLNIKGLIDIFDNNSLFKDDIEFKDYMTNHRSDNENILDGANTINPLYENDRKIVFQQKLTGLDSYFGDLITNKSFIGGARTIQLIYPYGINNDFNYWNQTKVNFNRGHRRGLGGLRGGGQLLNNPIYYDLYLLVTNKLFTHGFSDENVGAKLELLRLIVRRLESIEFTNDTQIDTTDFISKIYKGLGLQDYSTRGDELERYFPSNDTHEENDRNDDKIVTLKFKIDRHKQELGENYLELEQIKKEKDALTSNNNESKKNLILVINGVGTDISNKTVELSSINNQLDNLNQEKYLLNNSSYEIDPNDRSILNQEMVPENTNNEELANKYKILIDENIKLGIDNKTIMENIESNYKSKSKHDNLLNFNYEQEILNIEKKNNINLNIKESKRLEINKEILKMSKDNVERQQTLNKFQKDLDTQKEASLRQEFKLSIRSVTIDIKEEESEKRLEEAEKKLEEAKNNHDEAENKRNEAIKIKEESEKELVVMKNELQYEGNRNYELEREIANKKKEIEVHEKAIIEQDEVIRETGKKLEESEQQLDKMSNSNKILEESFNAQKEFNETLNQNIENLNEQITKKTESINQIKDKLVGISKETEKQGIKIISLNLESVKDENNELKTNITDLNKVLEELQKQQQDDKEQLQKLQQLQEDQALQLQKQQKQQKQQQYQQEQLSDVSKSVNELEIDLINIKTNLEMRHQSGASNSDVFHDMSELRNNTNEFLKSVNSESQSLTDGNKLKIYVDKLSEIIKELDLLDKKVQTGGSENDDNLDGTFTGKPFENQLEDLNIEIIELQNKKLQDLFDLKVFNEVSIKYKNNISKITKNRFEIKTIETIKNKLSSTQEENKKILYDQNETKAKIKKEKDDFENKKNSDLITINRQISDKENEVKVLKIRISDMESKKKILEESESESSNKPSREVIELQQIIEKSENIINIQNEEINRLEQEVKDLRNKSKKVVSIANLEEIKAILIQIKQKLDGISIFSDNDELSRQLKEVLEITDTQTGGAQRRLITSKQYEDIKKIVLSVNYIPGDSGAQVNQFDINNLYYVSSKINLKTNQNLSIHQCMKTYHIADIITSFGDVNIVICFWIWILLSNLEFFQFDINTDIDNLLYNDDQHESIINLARNIYIGEDNLLNLDWLNRNFVSDVEKLVYAISLYVDRMPQTPLLTHVSDTIFIIRQNYADDVRNRRLYQLHIDISDLQIFYLNPDSFITEKIIESRAYDPNNVKLLDEVFPSKIKFFINYTNIDDDNDKVYYIKKFVESYLLGLDFLGCFPKINELTNPLKVIHNPRQKYKLERDYDILDNHGFVQSSSILNTLRNFIVDRTNTLNGILVDLNNENARANVRRQQEIGEEMNEINNELAHLSLPGANQVVSILFGIFNIFIDRQYLVTNRDYIFLNEDEHSSYRLSNSSGLYNFFIESKNNINDYLKKTLIGERPFFSVYDEILNLESGYSDSFEKIFKDVYPLLLTLDDMIEDFRDHRYVSLVGKMNMNEVILKGSDDELQNLFKRNRFHLSEFDNYLNNINSFYFMYYYFAYDSNIFKIPKFTYYKIPKEKQNKFKLYGLDGQALEMINFGQNSVDPTTNQDEERDYGINYIGQEGGAESPTGFIHQNESVNIIRYIDGILKGNKYINPSVINEEIILSKTENLIPPSIEDNLDEFYKLIILDLIIKESQTIYNNLVNDGDMLNILSKISRNYNIENNQETIVYLYYVSKSIEELVSRYFKELIDFSANSIFKNLLSGNTKFSDIEELEFINNNSENFNFSLSITENDVSDYKKIMEDPRTLGKISKRMALNLFSFTDDYDEEIDQCGRSTKNDFIIYSNEYTNTDLTKSLQKIIIDVDILEKLLLAGSKIFESNKENKMPVFKILNHYNYKILEKLCGDNSSGGFGINYNYLGSKNYDNPIEYISDSLINHANKLLNNENKLTNIFRGFSFNCFQEINMLLNSDSKFGFNILKNLEFSYQMVSYLINQYLCTYLINVKDVKVSDNCNFYNIIKNYQNIPINNNDLAIIELKNDIDKIIIKNTNKINEINSRRVNNQKMNIINKLTNENNELQNIKNNLEDENVGIPLVNNRGIDNHKIIEKYEDIIDTQLNGDRGPFIEIWKEFLDEINDMKADCNLLLIRAVIKSTVAYHTNYFDLVESILEKASDFNEEYFKEHKYTEINPTLLFINDLLVFMTKNIICLGLEIFTKKLLLKYLLQKFPEKNNAWYINKINNVFNIQGTRKSTLKDFLYNDISERLVKNVSMIFKNRSEEISHSIESVEDILSEFIGVVQTNGVINISEEDMLIKILKRDVLKYFSLLTPSTIKNWQVLCENYMKFYINHFRVIKSHNILKN